MPCSDGPGGLPGYEYNRERAKLRLLDGLLCDITAAHGFDAIRRKLKEPVLGRYGDWHYEHQERDRERDIRKRILERSKEARRRALAKLTKEEKEALNIRD